MKIELKKAKNPSFGQELKTVEFNNTKRLVLASNETIKTESEKATMVIDGKKIKNGDTFYMMGKAGDIQKHRFAGAFETMDSLSHSASSTVELRFIPPKCRNPRSLWVIQNGALQVFSKEGLKKLKTQLGKLV